MEGSKIKQKLPIIAIVILLLFSVAKCTQSCNRQYIVDGKDIELAQMDSINQVLQDSIVELNHKIDLLTNDNENKEKIVETQKDAINKINEGKKKIQVTVKK